MALISIPSVCVSVSVSVSVPFSCFFSVAISFTVPVLFFLPISISIPLLFFCFLTLSVLLSGNVAFPSVTFSASLFLPGVVSVSIFVGGLGSIHRPFFAASPSPAARKLSVAYITKAPTTVRHFHLR